MAYRCLAEFLENLVRDGELIRIEREVDPAMEAAALAVAAAKDGRPAMLFAAIKGHHLPVLCNLLATERRICLALGVGAIEETAERVAGLLQNTASDNWFERLKGGAQPAAISSAAPRKIRAAACQQIVRLGGDVNLGDLPMLQTSSEETGLAIASATVISVEPDSRRPAFGQFDLERIDRNRLAVCWAASDELARLAGEYRERNQKMPLAAVIGGDPALLLAAAAPIPPCGDLCAVAGLLREKPTDVVDCRTIDLEAPAEAEIILEGFCDPGALQTEVGPRIAPLGHCTPPRSAPVMHVTAVTHRANPIFSVVLSGRPPSEACTVARAMQKVFRPLARLMMPELVDYDLPEFGAARHWAAVSIRKTYAGQARRAAHAAWNLRPMKFAKFMVVVDEQVNVADNAEVLAAIAANVRPGRDVIVDRGPADPFDPAAQQDAVTEKMAIDATRKLAGE